MKKIATPRNTDLDPNAELANYFWRWFTLSAFVLLVAAAIPAFSADVFIDEGDGDFAATPVSTPTADAPVVTAGKAPASEDVPPAGPGMDLDSEIGELEPTAAETTTSSGVGAPVVAEPSNENKVNDIMATSPKAEAAKAKKSAKKSSKGSDVSAKSKKKSSKMSAKSEKSGKKSAKKVGKKADKKKKKKSDVTAKSKKKSTKFASSKMAKRKVASVGKFAGGQYLTSTRSCTLESAPGAGGSSMTRASRKLWVEDSGNASYYKVYVKGGAAAYVSRDCF